METKKLKTYNEELIDALIQKDFFDRLEYARIEKAMHRCKLCGEEWDTMKEVFLCQKECEKEIER